MSNQSLVTADKSDSSRELRADFDRKSKLTDQANSTRLLGLIQGYLMWVGPWGQWWMFDGTQWRVDRKLEIDRLAAKVPGIVLEEASKASGDEADELARWGISSRKRSSQKAMIEGVKHLVAFDPDEFDQHNHLLNTKNGTVDLHTQELQPHNSSDYLTKRVDYDFNPNANAPSWVKFLTDVHGFNSERIALWQRLFGASLLGQRGFDRFVICYGTGANGKSINLGILGRLLGEYAKAASPTVFTSGKDDSQAFNIHALRSARVVTAIEVNKGSKLNLGLIKQMTGGDPIRSAEKYQSSIEWLPTWHLFFATNHKPQVDGQDNGTKRRLLYLHFKNKIPVEKQRSFDEYIEFLSKELTGILNWALIGLSDYLKNGLQVPRSIELENEAFMDEQDVIGDWLSERCEEHPGFTRFRELYDDYIAFSEDLNQHPLGTRKFGYALDEHDFRSERKSTVRIREGIRLKSTHGDSANPNFSTGNDSTTPDLGKLPLTVTPGVNFPNNGVDESLASQESFDDVEAFRW
jgi:putative DNA primase/helicase